MITHSMQDDIEPCLTCSQMSYQPETKVDRDSYKDNREQFKIAGMMCRLYMQRGKAGHPIRNVNCEKRKMLPFFEQYNIGTRYIL